MNPGSRSPLSCLQKCWAKLPQELFIVAYVFNPAFCFEGLNEFDEMLSPFALCGAVGQMYKVMFGKGLSVVELAVPRNQLFQQVHQNVTTPVH